MTVILKRAAGKALALLILLALLWAGFTILVEPMALRLAMAQDGIEQQRALLGRLLDQAKRLPVAANDPRDPAAPVHFLDGETDAQLIAGLQALIAQIADGAGVEVLSSQPTPGRIAAPLRLFGIQAQLRGSIEELQKLLHEIESSGPTLIVEAIDISRSGDAGDQPPGQLNMRMTVIGATTVSRS